MFGKWVLTALGLGAPMMRDDSDVQRAMRRAGVASFQHNCIMAKAQTAALDMIDQQSTDERPGRMLEDAEKTREVMERALGRMR